MEILNGSWAAAPKGDTTEVRDGEDSEVKNLGLDSVFPEVARIAKDENWCRRPQEKPHQSMSVKAEAEFYRMFPEVRRLKQ